MIESVRHEIKPRNKKYDFHTSHMLLMDHYSCAGGLPPSKKLWLFQSAKIGSREPGHHDMGSPGFTFPNNLIGRNTVTVYRSLLRFSAVKNTVLIVIRFCVIQQM